jgi:hypothetical protein
MNTNNKWETSRGASHAFWLKAACALAGISAWLWADAGLGQSLTWVNSKAQAVSLAQSQNKLILLLAGRPTCPHCIYMRGTVCETNSPDIKGTIQQNYIPWFCNMESSTEWVPYAGGLGSFGLPLICCINPTNANAFLDRTTGERPVQQFYNRLQSHVQTNSVVVPGTNQFMPAKGTYNGLFYEAGGVAPRSAGFFTVTTTARDTLSGRLQVGGTRYAFSGRFNRGSSFSQTVKRGRSGFCTVQLQTDAADPDRMLGTVTAFDGSWTADLAADRAVFNRRTNPAPQAGKYTLIISGSSDSAGEPGGESYGTVNVDAGGKITLAGSMADSTPTSQSAAVSKNGEWPLCVSLYRGRGSLLGWIRIRGRMGSGLGGDVSWIKPPLATAGYYPGGFTVEAAAWGSGYSPPPRGTPILGMSQAQILLHGGGLAQELTNYVTLSANNRVTSTNRVSLTFTLSTGAFKGSVPNPAGGRAKPISFGGVILPLQHSGKGYFLGNGQSGEVLFSAP